MAEFEGGGKIDTGIFCVGLSRLCLGGSEHHEPYSAQQIGLHRDQGQWGDISGTQELFCCESLKLNVKTSPLVLFGVT